VIEGIPVPEWAMRAAETGVPYTPSRQELLDAFGYDVMPALKGAPIEDVLRLFGMFGAVNPTIGVTGELEESARIGSAMLRNYDPYDSPGTALILAYQRALTRSSKERLPSDDLDVMHVAYAPYVDRFYADTRARMIANECACGERQHWNRRVNTSNIFTPPDLETLLEDLDQATRYWVL